MAINLAGYLFSDNGTEIGGATVKLFDSGGNEEDSDTTASSGTVDQSDSTKGKWTFAEADEDVYDIEITAGSQVRRIKGADKIQLSEIDVRNNAAAATPTFTFTNTYNSASNLVGRFRSLNTTRADGDEIYLSFNLVNDNAEETEFARITAEANDVSNGSEDGEIRFSVMKAGTLTDIWKIDSSTAGATTLDINADALTIGSAGDTDITLTFDANTGDGVITWMEDEDYFAFSDDILLNTTEKLQLRDTAIYLYSSADAQADLVADSVIQVTAPTVNIEASTAITLESDSVTFGEAGDADIVLNFNANTADGVITWMEDEDYFKFSDEVLMNSTEKMLFGDTGTFIHQSSDGVLTITSDTTVDINGAVVFDGALSGITTIAATGDVTLSGGGDGALQFTNAGENSIKIPDNQASALIIEEANNAYITFVTTNSSEAITIAKATTFSAGIADAGTISSGTWNGTKIATGYIADNAITNTLMADDAIDSDEVAAGAIDLAHMNSESVDEDNLYISNSGSNGQFLSKQSGNNGGLTWATPAATATAADDIADGDGAVSILTTLGNITIDAQANDADVIIKVDDAGASITAVTFDGSDEGNAIFVNDVQLKSDSAVLEFGADLDTTLTHTDGTGLTLNSTNKLTFGDVATFIQQSSDGVLTIESDTTVDINGAVVFDGAVTGATSVTVDDIAVDGKVITMTGSSSDTAVFTAGTNGTLSIVTTDAAAAAANIQITADGTAELAGTTVTLDSAGDIALDATDDINIPVDVGLTFGDDGEKIEGDGTNLVVESSGTLDMNSGGILTLDSGAAINIEPASGSAILLDGTITVDAASITATDLIIGEDSQTAIDFGTADEIDFKINNATELTLSASSLYPVTDNGLNLGAAATRWKTMYGQQFHMDTSADGIDSHDYAGISITVKVGDGADVGAWDLVCISDVTNEVQVADADAIATSRVIGINPSDSAISDNSEGTILLFGVVRDDSWSWTTGQTLYLGTGGTGSTITATAPSGTDDCVVPIGIALEPDMIYFNPSQTIIEHA